MQLAVLAGIYWLMLAGFTGWLAAERGRPFSTWLPLGILFGPFALFAVGFAPVKTKARRRRRRRARRPAQPVLDTVESGVTPVYTTPTPLHEGVYTASSNGA